MKKKHAHHHTPCSRCRETTRSPVLLVTVKPALKYSKLPKYFDQDCNFDNDILNKNDDLFDKIDG